MTVADTSHFQATKNVDGLEAPQAIFLAFRQLKTRFLKEKPMKNDAKT